MIEEQGSSSDRKSMTDHSMKEGLLALAERCEKATGPEPGLDALIAVAIRFAYEDIEGVELDADEETGAVTAYVAGKRIKKFSSPNFTASLDAAMTLVPDDRGPYRFFSIEHDAHDGARWVARFDSSGDECGHGETIYCEGNTPALALCAAALRSRASMEKD